MQKKEDKSCVTKLNIWFIYNLNQKHLERFEMWCWRRMEKISWTDHMRNEKVLESRSRGISYMK